MEKRGFGNIRQRSGRTVIRTPPYCRLCSAKELAQGAQGVVDVRFDGAHRQTEFLGNLLVAHIVKVTHAEHLAATVGQTLYGGDEVLAQVVNLKPALRRERRVGIEKFTATRAQLFEQGYV